MILVCQIFHIILTFHRTRMYILHLLISLNQNNHWNPIVIMMPTLASLAVAEANNNIQWVPRVKLASWQLSISVISFWLSTVNDGAYKRRDGNFTKVSRIIKTARFILLIFFNQTTVWQAFPDAANHRQVLFALGPLLITPLDKMAVIFADDIFKSLFMNEKFCLFPFEFYWNLFLRVQLTMSQYWFRQWLDAEQGPVSISEKTPFRKIS